MIKTALRLYASLALLVTPSVAVAQTDIAESFQVRPGGRLTGSVLFAAKVDDSMKIFLADLGGKTVRQVVGDAGNHTYPSFSPDGYRFAFVSDRDGGEEIYVADFDGKNVRRVTENKLADDHPEWATDDTIFFTSTTKDGGGESQNIWKVSPNGGSPVQVTQLSGRNITPSYDPRGNRIAFGTDRFWPGSDICLFDLSAKKESCVLSGTKGFLRPRFSRSGDRVAYSTGEATNLDIGVLSLEKKRQTLPISHPGKQFDPTWVGDTHIAYTSDHESPDLYSIYSASAEDGQGSALISGPYSIRSLSWTPLSVRELEARKLNESDPVLRVVPMNPPPGYTPPYILSPGSSQ